MPERLLLGIQQGCIKLYGWSTTYANGMPAVVSAVTRRFRLAMSSLGAACKSEGRDLLGFSQFYLWASCSALDSTSIGNNEQISMMLWLNSRY